MVEKKQLNFGLVDSAAVQEIMATAEKFTSDLMNDGYGRLNKKQFMADFSEVFLPTITKWVATGMSLGESKREATRAVVRERMLEDVNAKVKELLVEINRILQGKVDSLLEEYYGPSASES